MELSEIHEIDDNEIEKMISRENNDLRELEINLDALVGLLELSYNMICDQGESLETVDKVIEITEEAVQIGTDNLEIASEYKTKLRALVRKIGLVLGGGAIGIPGFLLGPIVGIGTVITGVTMGGVAAVNINKLELLLEKIRKLKLSN